MKHLAGYDKCSIAEGQDNGSRCLNPGEVSHGQTELGWACENRWCLWLGCSVYSRLLDFHSLWVTASLWLMFATTRPLTCTLLCCPVGGSGAEEREHIGQSSEGATRPVHSTVRNQEEREVYGLHLLNERTGVVFVYIWIFFPLFSKATFNIEIQ